MGAKGIGSKGHQPGSPPIGTTAETLVGARGALFAGIVDWSELPRDRSTLLVRFMAAGPRLAGAIADLGAVEEGAYESAVVEQNRVDVEHVLDRKSSPTPEETPEEEELVVSSRAPGRTRDGSGARRRTLRSC